MTLKRSWVLSAVLVVAWATAVWAEDMAGTDATQVTPVEVTEAAPVPPQPDDVLAEVNGEKLFYWQAEKMVEQRAARDVPGAVELWTTVKLKADEAERQELDAPRENAWIIDLYRKFYMSRLLDEQNAKAAGDAVTEEQARQQYDAKPEDYVRPMTAELKHIMLTSRTEADEVAEKAKAEGADFDALIKQYSKAQDKSRQGLVRGNDRLLTQMLGKDVLDAVMVAEVGAILGPIQGAKGFEIVKVEKVTPKEQIPFEEAKNSIMQQKKSEAAQKAEEQLMESLRGKATVQKTPLLERLIEEQKKAAPPVAPQPGPMPRR